MYSLKLQPHAERDLKKVTPSVRQKMLSAIPDLVNNPYSGKVLHGKYKNYRSFRVWPHRIIYEIDVVANIIWVIKIDHRKDAYK